MPACCMFTAVAKSLLPNRLLVRASTKKSIKSKKLLLHCILFSLSYAIIFCTLYIYFYSFLQLQK